MDNEARFAELTRTGEGPIKYIENYDHLTPDGYRALAENVAKSLDIVLP